MPSTRRSLLAALGAAVVAGCSTGSDDGPGTATGRDGSPTVTGTAGRTDDADQTATASPTETDQPTETDRSTATPPESVDGSWPQTSFDAAGTGHNPSASGSDERLREAWAIELDGEAQWPLVADERLITGVDGSIRAWDAASGDELWKQSYDGDVRTAAIADGRLFAVEYEGVAPHQGDPVALRALELDGSEAWTVDRRSRPRAVAGETLFAFEGERDAELVARSIADGSEQWRAAAEDVEAPGSTYFDAIGVGADRVFATFDNGGSVGGMAALDRETGEERWHGSGPNHGSFPTIAGGRIFSGGFYGKVRSWTLDGEDVRTDHPTTIVSSILAGDGRVYVNSPSDAEPKVTALDAATGEERWTRDTGWVAALGGDVAYVDDGDLVAVDAADGSERWTLPAEGEVQTVLPVGDVCYVVTRDEGSDAIRLFV